MKEIILEHGMALIAFAGVVLAMQTIIVNEVKSRIEQKKLLRRTASIRKFLYGE